jgi:hypothetical protein
MTLWVSDGRPELRYRLSTTAKLLWKGEAHMVK